MTLRLNCSICGPHTSAYWLVHVCTETEAVQVLCSTITLPGFSLMNIPANLMILACIRVCFCRVKIIFPIPPTPVNIAVWTLSSTLREYCKGQLCATSGQKSPVPSPGYRWTSSIDLISSYMQTDTVLLISPCQRHTSWQVWLQKWNQNEK